MKIAPRFFPGIEQARPAAAGNDVRDAVFHGSVVKVLMSLKNDVDSVLDKELMKGIPFFPVFVQTVSLSCRGGEKGHMNEDDPSFERFFELFFEPFELFAGDLVQRAGHGGTEDEKLCVLDGKGVVRRLVDHLFVDPEPFEVVKILVSRSDMDHPSRTGEVEKTLPFLLASP